MSAAAKAVIGVAAALTLCGGVGCCALRRNDRRKWALRGDVEMMDLVLDDNERALAWRNRDRSTLQRTWHIHPHNIVLDAWISGPSRVCILFFIAF